jgi:hypothetical protein
MKIAVMANNRNNVASRCLFMAATKHWEQRHMAKRRNCMTIGIFTDLEAWQTLPEEPHQKLPYVITPRSICSCVRRSKRHSNILDLASCRAGCGPCWQKATIPVTLLTSHYRYGRGGTHACSSDKRSLPCETGPHSIKTDFIECSIKKVAQQTPYSITAFCFYLTCATPTTGTTRYKSPPQLEEKNFKKATKR